MTEKNLPMLTTQLPVPVAGGMDSFITWAYKIPVLDVEEEQGLAIRYREHNDLEAAHKLVMHNMRFVIHIARGYRGYGLALSDLVQEGTIGLMKAVKRFDPNVRVRLISFAVYWIRAEIHEFILKNWRIAKVATTKAQRKLFFNLRSMKKRIAWLNREEVEEISDQLGVKPEEVLEMEKRMSDQDISFDAASTATCGERDEPVFSPSEYLADPNSLDPAQEAEEEQWKSQCYQRMREQLEKLDPRSLEIVRLRWLNSKKATLSDLAKRFKISAERIRQIEDKALKQLRATI